MTTDTDNAKYEFVMSEAYSSGEFDEEAERHAVEMWESRLDGELHHKDRYIARRDAAWLEYVEAVNDLTRKERVYNDAVARCKMLAAQYVDLQERYERMQERIAYIELQIAERES